MRDTVGAQPTLELDLPDHLAALHDPLANGRIDEAIAMLAGDAYANDGAATLVRAHCLVFVKRFEEALLAFEAARASHQRDADLGSADALIGLGRADEALVILDTMPDDVTANESRVLALQQLWREAEAEAALAKVLSIRGRHANVRVRSLQR